MYATAPKRHNRRQKRLRQDTGRRAEKRLPFDPESPAEFLMRSDTAHAVNMSGGETGGPN